MRSYEQTTRWRRYSGRELRYEVPNRHILHCTHHSVNQQPQTSLAAGAILDWLETHGGEVCLLGVQANVAAISDGLLWPQTYYPTCGRLIRFLRKHGVASASDANVIVGMVLDAGA